MGPHLRAFFFGIILPDARRWPRLDPEVPFGVVAILRKQTGRVKHT
jgi:hypothetical protein